MTLIFCDFVNGIRDNILISIPIAFGAALVLPELHAVGYVMIFFSVIGAAGFAQKARQTSIPSNASTEEIAKMKDGVFLVNTARGGIINEEALLDAARSGKVGAALDVFENEPYVPVDSTKDLRKLPQVLLTPHIGSSTAEACERMARRALANIKACFEKKYEQMDIVNPQVITRL